MRVRIVKRHPLRGDRHLFDREQETRNIIPGNMKRNPPMRETGADISISRGPCSFALTMETLVRIMVVITTSRHITPGTMKIADSRGGLNSTRTSKQFASSFIRVKDNHFIVRSGARPILRGR